MQIGQGGLDSGWGRGSLWLFIMSSGGPLTPRYSAAEIRIGLNEDLSVGGSHLAGQLAYPPPFKIKALEPRAKKEAR